MVQEQDVLAQVSSALGDDFTVAGVSVTPAGKRRVARITVERPVVEEELVAQARTAARLHGDTQPQVRAALLLEQRAHLAGRHVGQLDLVRGQALGVLGRADLDAGLLCGQSHRDLLRSWGADGAVTRVWSPGQH